VLKGEQGFGFLVYEGLKGTISDESRLLNTVKSQVGLPLEWKMFGGKG
jgi:hypothetical protein